MIETPPPCRIMMLPEEVLVAAARTAIDIFPANSPAAPYVNMLTIQQTAVLTTSYFGPKPRVLTVQSLDGASRTLMDRIISHANAWDCCITYAWTEGRGDVRITREGNAYASYLGTDIFHVPPDLPTMWLGQFREQTSEATFRRVVRHEFGHQDGFPHEHLRKKIVDRIDRQKAYAYFLAWQGWDASMVDVNVLTPIEERSLIVLDDDPESDSIMTYPLPGEIMIDGIPVVGGDDLTPSDLAFADKVYPLPVVVQPPPPVEPPPAPPPPPPPDKPDGEVYDLRVGVTSDWFTMLPGATILFRFRLARKRAIAAVTRGEAALEMDLRDGSGRVLVRDDRGRGPGANAMIARALPKGEYTLAVRGQEGIGVGPFRVKVAGI